MEFESTEQDVMLDGSDDLMSTSNTSTNGAGSDTNGSAKKSSIISPDPTSYVTKARVTRPTPPPPSKNPMQFVQIKPCNLYQSAQQQLKKAEEVKKLKEVKKEEPEDWQCNLDNWKSSRRKRVEHIIDRVVETKKLELEEHDRMRRKSKTFTEMMEERAERGPQRGRAKLANLAVYNEDEANDFSDLGIGTSSASGKSSLSEDYDNNSVMSENAAELTKPIGAVAAAAAAGSIEEQQNHINSNRNNGHANGLNKSSSNQASTSRQALSNGAGGGAAAIRESIPSPGYETCSSTAPASSPDPCEYTYEGAIQDYKQRSSKLLNNNANQRDKQSNGGGGGESSIAYPMRRGSKIEDRLSGFEVSSPSGEQAQEGAEKQKVDVPKVDISKRKEIFEQQQRNGNANAAAAPAQEVKRLSSELGSIRERMQSLEQPRPAFNSSKSVDVPVPPLKQRLNSLQQHVVTKEEEQQRKPPLVALIDARQLEIMRGEEQRMRQQQQQQKEQQTKQTAPPPPALIVEQVEHDDSGIQADNQEEQLKEQQQQQQLNEAIAALALEELQLEQAAQAVNQIEAEFDELTDCQPAALPATAAAPAATVAAAAAAATQQAAAAPARDMEFSVSSTNNFNANVSLSPRSLSEQDQKVVVVASSSAYNPTTPNTSVTVPNPHPNPNLCNLRRKPSNEMIHHRNLLKMFKDTFQSDQTLHESADEPLSPPGQFSQVFDFTKTPAPTSPTPPPIVKSPPASVAAATVKPTVSSPPTTHIPRPLGKPPMSPKALRCAAKPVPAPAASAGAAQQFSINGRVEIFNSRQLDKPPTPPPRRAFRPEPQATQPPNSEVVICAPPMTVVLPEELPKPNTVKALSSCFAQSPPVSPKALPRSRIPQITPPASPKPLRRATPTLDEVDRSSGDYAPVHGQTRAVVHTPPTPAAKPLPVAKPNSDPLAPNDSLAVHLSAPAAMPALRICTPNESSLFKLASSTPTSPTSPRSPVPEYKLCQQFLEQESAKQQFTLAAEDLQRLEQLAVQELPCDRVDASQLPKLPSTGCQLVSEEQIRAVDGIKQQMAPAAAPATPKAEDVALCIGLLDCLAPAQEPECSRIDVQEQPVPATGYQDVSEAELLRCDGMQAAKPSRESIDEARAAHSKALMDTCEQIIAEERLASSQMMNCSLPSEQRTPSSSTPGTPLLGRRSKIPIPKPCCISASNTDSITRTGYMPAGAAVEQPLIARTKLVETEINVKQLTPPSSPKAKEKEKSKDKKTKNIFDFLRRNFGHNEEASKVQPAHPTLNETLEPKVVLTSTRSGVDVVNADGEFVRVDNSRFYLPGGGEEATPPPPLPKTPAPVNIEIRKTITTDEILEENTTEQALSQEISDLLDDELNKLEANAEGQLKVVIGAGH